MAVLPPKLQSTESMPLLDWLNKNQALRTAGRVPFRLLETVSVHGDADNHNWLIQGDNLEALKALLPFHAGRVKCIYIDPPYNTRSAFEHYDDNLEHSQWLSMIYPRLELLRELLAEDGSIWVSIDDNEAHYLKVVMDEIFGRGNFVANVVWQKRTSPDARLFIGDAHDHVLLYAKSREKFALNRIALSAEQAAQFKNPDSDPRGPWTSTDFTAQGWRPNQMYTIATPSGVEYEPPPGRCWANIQSEFKRLLIEERLWFGKEGNARPRVKSFLSEHDGVRAWSWWSNAEVGHNQEAKKEINALFGADDAFDTPKPERLLQRVLTLATNPGDLVLDSFLGSGTTAAVAHKMGRRWIGIEMGEHAETHCLPRLEKVVAGEQGGISAAVNWSGGSGFRFMRLGDAVFEADGRINPVIRFTTLAAWVWYQETRTPWPLPSPDNTQTPLIGIHEGTAYYLLYNGILGDRRPQGGNVLTGPLLATLNELAPHNGPRVIYGESCRLSPQRLKAAGIVFKQIPYDIRAR
ncbi:MAG: site-specific DNA-methyltransferase [Azonexus sp.]|jgi:adenine-specific DNA-methyltransferase|nr:site-specific DNA-methyltransferase [Azonexus sp.]